MMIFKIYYHLIAILKKVLFYIVYGNRISFGKHTTFRRGFEIAIEQEGKIIIGENCFFNHRCSLSSLKLIKIGSGSIFGENVKFYDSNHHFSHSGLIKDQGYSTGEIHVGDHCWVGSNVTFLKGANVGNDCIIGAGCTIDGIIPDKTLVVPDRQLTFKPIMKKESENNHGENH